MSLRDISIWILTLIHCSLIESSCSTLQNEVGRNSSVYVQLLKFHPFLESDPGPERVAYADHSGNPTHFHFQSHTLRKYLGAL